MVYTEPQQSLPRLLLVSEAPLNQNGTGIDRTLFNLLDQYPINQFRLYTTCESSGQTLTSPPFNTKVTRFKPAILPLIPNRLGLIFNPLLRYLNYQLLDWLPLQNLEEVKAFNPEVILICPNTPAALVIGYKISEALDCPFLIYFMDDWIDNDDSKWILGGIQQYSKLLLERADGWLMISSQLENDLVGRYRILPKRSLVVHNPVDLASLSQPDFSIHEGTFKIIYAGSIWTMHYDAVTVIADAIFELRRQGYDIEFILHTPAVFWQKYQLFWESRQVVNGGMIPYKDLQTYLQQADLLLVASSFRQDHAHVSRSSVQTKLTDYMASGRPILSCGPIYGACNGFVKNWNCGLICNTDNISAIKQLLIQAVQDRATNQVFAYNAFHVVKQQFDKQKVSEKLYQFIAESLPDAACLVN